MAMNTTFSGGKRGLQGLLDRETEQMALQLSRVFPALWETRRN